ncbi:MAG: HD domain-containing protein [Phycisphaerales bacterium]
MPATDNSVQPEIRSLAPTQRVDGVYSLINPQLAMAKNGNTYLKCLLRDASGEIAARLWNCRESVHAQIAQAAFVRVVGRTEPYNNSVQLIIEEIQPAEPSADELSRLVPTTKYDIERMFAEVSEILRSLKHPGVQALAEAYLNDETLMRRFRRAPAAVSVHHAFLGGLLEHTLQLLKLADRMLPLYPDLNRDLVLMGLFLHDLGKTSELEWERGFNYTMRGNLLGHVIDGVLMLRAKFALVKATNAASLPLAAQTILEHIVVSHHDQLEFGAAKRPSTPEAVFVAMLDNLDAKTAMSLANARRDSYDGDADPGADFTEKLWALDTRIYRPDPLRERSGG